MLFKEMFKFFIMLTGSELIAKTKELKDVTETEKVRACGYVTTSKNGKERCNFNAYYKAIAMAQGYKSSGDGDKNTIGKGGRKLSYIATVQGNGNLLIGKAYTAILDLKAGDEFEIKLGRKQIKLLPTGESE